MLLLANHQEGVSSTGVTLRIETNICVYVNGLLINFLTLDWCNIIRIQLYIQYNYSCSVQLYPFIS